MRYSPVMHFLGWGGGGGERGSRKVNIEFTSYGTQ